MKTVDVSEIGTKLKALIPFDLVSGKERIASVVALTKDVGLETLTSTQCTKCAKESNALVLLLNDRALCPECIMKAYDVDSIVAKLKSNPELRSILYHIYPPEREDHPSNCSVCGVLFDIGMQVKNVRFCIPCGLKQKPEEMKAMMKAIG
jgi:hypothetical protein